MTTSHHTRRTPRSPGVRRARSGRRAEVVRGIGAVGLLALLVGGLPSLLWWIGGAPLPDSMPSLTRVGDWLLQPDSGQLLLSVLLGLAWLGWAWFTLGVIAETTAQVRGRSLPRLPALGPPQQLAAQLVAVAALLLPGQPVALFAPAPSPVTVTEPAHTVPTVGPQAPNTTPTPQVPDREVDAAPVADTTAPAAGKVYVVQPAHNGSRDSLWSIAERHLGDPLRWPEIARLNHGRPQPDGRRLTDPHWIFPGWRLHMPADATALPTVATPPADTDTSGRRDTSPSPTPPVPTDDAPPRSAEAAPPDDDATARAASHPATPVPTTTGAPTAAPDRGGATSGDRRDTVADALPLGALVAGGGLLAAGLVVALARARTVARRRRPTGTRIPRPAPDVAAVEVRLRVLAEPDDRAFLDVALRSLSLLTARRRAHDPHAALPELLAARLTATALELHLAEPAADPPPPYTTSADGRIWTLDKDADLPMDAATACTVLAPYPGLVPVGHDDTGLLLLDLEGVGSIAIDGDPDQARQLLAWMCAELALGRWSDDLSATVAGLPEQLADLRTDRVRVLDRIDAATAEQLATARATHVLDGRLGDSPDSVMPEFLLLAQPSLADAAAAVDGLAGGDARSGVAVVVAAAWPAARWTLTIDAAGRLTVPELGLTVRANLLDEQTLHVMTGLLAAGNDRTDDTPHEQDSGAETTAPQPDAVGPPKAKTETPETAETPTASFVDDLDAAAAAYLDDNRTDVTRVAIIGPVQVRAAGPVARNRASVCTELITYLATHPDVEDPSKLDLALWPDRAVLTTTRNEVIARARKWLGHHYDGNLHLPHRRDGSPLRLGPGVLLDWDLFHRLARRGLATGEAGADDLAVALRLVRGKPFENVPAIRYAWVAETFLEQDIATQVVDVAHTLAQHQIRTGDPDAARETARTGQLVDQYDERLWRDLLLAEHQLGNINAVRLLVTNLSTVLEADIDDDLQEETNDLIHRLLPRSQAS